MKLAWSDKEQIQNFNSGTRFKTVTSKTKNNMGNNRCNIPENLGDPIKHNIRTYISRKLKEIIQNMPNIREYTALQPRLWWYIVSLADLPTSLVTSCRPLFRIDIGWLSATPLTDLLLRLFSLSQASQSSFSVGIGTTSRVSAVYTLNTDPKINVINSYESFLTTTCKHDNNFKKRGKVWSNSIKSRQKKNTQNTRAAKKLDKMSARLEVTLKTVGSTCAANGHVCIVSTNFSKTTAFRAIQKKLWFTNSTTHTSWTKREFCEMVPPWATK